MPNAPKRQNRPAFTQEEVQALHRILRSPDGQVLLNRLERVKRYKQDRADDITDHSRSMQHQGQIKEIKEIVREFEEADNAAKPDGPVVDRQKRFG